MICGAVTPLQTQFGACKRLFGSISHPRELGNRQTLHLPKAYGGLCIAGPARSACYLRRWRRWRTHDDGKHTQRQLHLSISIFGLIIILCSMPGSVAQLVMRPEGYQKSPVCRLYAAQGLSCGVRKSWVRVPPEPTFLFRRGIEMTTLRAP